MTLRIGFDMDGTLADFGGAFHDVEARLFGAGPQIREGQPERREAAQSQTSESPQPGPVTEDDTAVPAIMPVESSRRRAAIWTTIQATPDFWRGLKPLEEGAVRRIHKLMLQHKWEVFFITQRPYTEGDTVQRQTQKWLVDQGFDLPSVLVIGGGRGAAAAALRLDFHVDDSLQNCLDVVSDSSARPLLIVQEADAAAVASARRIGVATAPGIGMCLDVLERATSAQGQPGLLDRLSALVGWR